MLELGEMRLQTILLFLSPIKKGVDHVDGGLRDLNAWVGLGQVNRVGIKTDGLAISIVMSTESGLHVVERGAVIDGRGTVGRITKSRGFRNQSVSVTAGELTAKGPSDEGHHCPYYRRRHTSGSPRIQEVWVGPCKRRESTNSC